MLSFAALASVKPAIVADTKLRDKRVEYFRITTDNSALGGGISQTTISPESRRTNDCTYVSPPPEAHTLAKLVSTVSVCMWDQYTFATLQKIMKL